MIKMRRYLGIFVMSAGVIGLLLSLTGLAGLLTIRPVLVDGVNSAVDLLYSNVDSSLKAMEIADETLTATIKSVDSLSSMLSSTANTVDDSKLMLKQLNDITGEKLPATLDAATSSLMAAQEAATSLESAIKSFESFQKVMSAIPLLNTFVPKSSGSYTPEKPFAESLGEMADSMEDMPDILVGMSKNMETADDNLSDVQSDLEDMAGNVALIARGLKEYKTIIQDSIGSMVQMKTMLENAKENSQRTINWITVVLALFFLWLLAAQVVIFSQGWELFHGTANKIDGPNSSTVLDSQQMEEKS